MSKCSVCGKKRDTRPGKNQCRGCENERKRYIRRLERFERNSAELDRAFEDAGVSRAATAAGRLEDLRSAWSITAQYTPATSTGRRVVIPDLHIPYQDAAYEKVLFAVLKDFKPDSIIQLGDLIDAESISDFGKQRLDMSSFAAECKAANVFLDKLQKACPNITLLGGNHDDPEPQTGRPGKYAAKHEEMAEFTDVRERFNLEKRGIKYVTVAEQPFVDGPSAYFHGIGWESSNFAPRIANEYVPVSCLGKTLFGGHMHTLAFAAGIAGGSYQCCGYGANPKAPCFRYKTKAGSPSKWRQAFVLQETIGDRMTYTVIEVRSGQAVWNGKVYG